MNIVIFGLSKSVTLNIKKMKKMIKKAELLLRDFYKQKEDINF